jgi:hypothetical protein
MHQVSLRSTQPTKNGQGIDINKGLTRHFNSIECFPPSLYINIVFCQDNLDAFPLLTLWFD